ncbi:fructose-bisphosphate aldolase [Algimonas ampicilliniresistens]|uniref:fructose-bisphosphate aldolase n=1 Tax=Algimonas ampicilliniresistens TaxID=1298735 RepID=A0ABQ5VBQ6_9PROT|nr:class I fructose-bisphosphate aldolase [Algimonas ampicilliniresistens]GLQ24021.1 fructose-bisphosphate aldolase [Algimonas ampicilliniresistens]
MSRLDDMVAVAEAMVKPGKGILAADESTGTIGKRFASIGTENIETNRRDWRDMLFRTRPAMDDHISGVILYDETLRQSAADGTSMVELIKATGAIPGIKVDKGITPLAGRPGETITQGLDGLRERLAEYYELGARFAKWRAVIEISHPDVTVGRTPTEGGIKANTHALGRYAALCQEAGIVPIVEPEVLMGGAHSVERCHEVTERALNSLFTELYEQGVALEATILKPNMVVAGKQCAEQPTREQIATRTIKVLKDTVPAAVPGIAFLSGGQENEEATRNLDMMNKIGGFPWKLTYSYGRALQQSALFAWQGKAENYAAAQAAFTHRAKMNGLASKGEWSADIDAEVDA